MKRFLTVLLSLIMMLGMMPMATMTAYADTSQGSVEYLSPKFYGGQSINGVKRWEKLQCTDYTLINAGADTPTTLSDGWYVVDGGTEVSPIKFSKGIFIEGDVKLILKDNSHIEVIADSSNENSAGIQVTSDANLTVYAQSEGNEMGQLKAEASQNGAAIGGCFGVDGENITINGGNIIATNNGAGAAIGGGKSSSKVIESIEISSVCAVTTGDGVMGPNITYNPPTTLCYINVSAREGGDGKNITINGGKITATNKGRGAAIGGGAGGNGTDIIINGGEITAKSTTGTGAAIGGGGYNWYSTQVINHMDTKVWAIMDEQVYISGDGVNITINGGNVVATSKASEKNSRAGAGIGGGAALFNDSGCGCKGGDGKNITITGGIVTASSIVENAVGTNTCGPEEGPGAGIGGGNGGNADGITIAGGIIVAESICQVDLNNFPNSYVGNPLYLYEPDLHVNEYFAEAASGSTLIAGAGIGGGAGYIRDLKRNDIQVWEDDNYMCGTGTASNIQILGGDITAESRVEFTNGSNTNLYNFTGVGIGNGYIGTGATATDITVNTQSPSFTVYQGTSENSVSQTELSSDVININSRYVHIVAPDWRIATFDDEDDESSYNPIKYAYADDGTYMTEEEVYKYNDELHKKEVASMQQAAEDWRVYCKSKLGKKGLKVYAYLDGQGDKELQEWLGKGYRAEYDWYRTTNPKKGYKYIYTTDTYCYYNTSVVAGKTYHYKCKITIYDNEGRIIRTLLTHCTKAYRTYQKKS